MPGSPAKLTATPGAKGGKATATVKWSGPGSTGGAAVSGYRITWQRLDAKGKAQGAPVVYAVTAAYRSASLTAPAGVRAETRYRVTVQAVNPAGVGSGRAVVATVR